MNTRMCESCVQTCGICETICNESEVPTHECLEGYTNYITDENLYFYPLLDDGTVVRKSMIQGTESITSVPFHGDNLENIQPINNRKLRKNRKLSSEEEELLLILEVEQREPLWNFKLPLAQRSSRVTKALWEEISKALNGTLSAIEGKNKFKNLHDTYRRLIQCEQLPSGSASRNNMNNWKHYKTMEFLRDCCLKKKTISNINEDNSSDNITEDSQESITSKDNCKRKKISTLESESPLKRIADALSQPVPNVVLPSLPEEDHIDGVLKLFGYNLRRMSPFQQDEWIQRCLQISYDMLKENF